LIQKTGFSYLSLFNDTWEGNQVTPLEHGELLMSYLILYLISKRLEFVYRLRLTEQYILGPLLDKFFEN